MFISNFKKSLSETLSVLTRLDQNNSRRKQGKSFCFSKLKKNRTWPAATVHVIIIGSMHF